MVVMGGVGWVVGGGGSGSGGEGPVTVRNDEPHGDRPAMDRRVTGPPHRSNTQRKHDHEGCGLGRPGMR